MVAGNVEFERKSTARLTSPPTPVIFMYISALSSLLRLAADLKYPKRAERVFLQQYLSTVSLGFSLL